MTAPSQPGGGPQEPTPSYAPPHGTTTTTTGAPGAPGPGAAKGLAIAALATGGVAFLTGFVPVLGLVVGIAAVVLGVLALLRRQPKALAVTGLVLGAVGLVTSLLVTIGVGAVLRGAAESPAPAPTQQVEQESSAASPTPTTDDEAPTPTPSASVDPDAPEGAAAALEAAETRAVFLGSSKAETYDHVLSTGATPEAAQYAVDTIDVDWAENAAKKARSYRDGGMPVETIHDQLTSEYGERFTVEEADYAMAHLDD